MLKYLCVFFLGLPTVARADLPELRFRPYTKLSGEKEIRLIHLVDESGLPGAIKEKLKKISVADTPALGEQRVFTSQFISGIVRQHLREKIVTVRIPTQLVVVNRGYEISEEVLRSELISQWQNVCRACRFEIERIKVPALPLALRNRPWRIQAATTPPKGSFTEKLFINGADGAEQTFWINGAVKVLKKVPVATRTLASSFRLSPEDIRLEWRDVTHATDGTLGEAEIIGQQVRFAIPANQVIWANSVVREKAVKRGDLVRVTTGSDDWQVVLQAVTEQDAYVGDRVNLRNVQTKKVITGEVVGPGLVVVE